MLDCRHWKFAHEAILIYRIATRADWIRAQSAGEFVSADLAAEGFIHASEEHQVLATAARHYRGQHELVLLAIDEAELDGVDVKREDTSGRGERYPHVYAPIPLAAVVRVAAFGSNEAGEFQWPSRWETVLSGT
jgi:uncharacterized protein (DUF952 family)